MSRVPTSPPDGVTRPAPPPLPPLRQNGVNGSCTICGIEANTGLWIDYKGKRYHLRCLKDFTESIEWKYVAAYQG